MPDQPHDDEDAHGKPTELPATETGSPSSASSTEQIGPYRLLDKLGEGGMGEVWLAEQTEPVKRKVALKVIKQGMDTKQVVARFEAEKQALAIMDHPAIAKVYDAGATPRGRPYFAMEHVQGVPITEYCDRQRLTNRQRLDLFMQVCEGVQHAHHKAVIHRDLKPGNVLVTIRDDRPVPKIIDFGVAKATAQKLTAQTMHTQLGVMIGTPAYMSPEQAEMTGQNIDTRTDIYALGVMLYELLVGALPFDMKDFKEAGFEGMVRKIREDEPPRPSTRLSTLGEHSTQSAKKRRTELPALKRELSGDLDWITLKALEKDRTRRYGSPQDLAADIQRYLTDQPVLASPPSAAYRARKFIRRHTWGVAAAAVGVLVLIGFAATMGVQAKRIAAERDLAEQARADMESVVEFQAGMLSETDPEAMGRRLMAELSGRVAEVQRAGGSTEEQVAAALSTHAESVRGVNATNLALGLVDEDILGRAVAELDKKFGDRPLIDARLRRTIGNTYRKLGRYERAEPQLEAALATRKRVLGDDHPDTLSSMNSLARLYENQGRFAEAESLLLETLATRKRVLGDDHPDTLESAGGLGWVYFRQGRYAEAEPLYLETLETRERVLGDDHPDTLNTAKNLGFLYLRQDRHEAEPLLLETLETRKRVLGDDHRDTLGSVNDLAILYEEQGRHAEAETLYLENLQNQKRVLGDDHADTLNSMNNLAIVYVDQGRYAEAETLHLETLETRKRVLGDDHPFTLSSMANLAWLYRQQGRHDEAESLYLEALETCKRALGDDHSSTLASMINLANFYRGRRRNAEAEPLMVQVVERRRRALGDDHRDTLFSMNDLAYLYMDLDRDDLAEPLFLRTIESQKRVLGDDHNETIDSMRGLAIFYSKQGRHGETDQVHAEILEIHKETLETRRRVLGDDHPSTLHSMNRLANLYKSRQHFAQAEPLYLEAFETRKRVLGDDSPGTLVSMNNLAYVYAYLDRDELAEPLFLQTIELMKRVWGNAHRETMDSMSGLADLYLKQERYAEAVPLLLENLETQRRVLGDDHFAVLRSVNTLSSVYYRQGRHAEAGSLLLENLEAAKRVLRDDNPFDWVYNLAQTAALQGKRNEAMDWLRQCVEAGVASADRIALESDFESLHGPEFDALVERAGGAPVQVAVDPEILATYAGDYELAPGFVLTVRYEGSRLFTRATGQPEFEIFAKSETEFFVQAFDARVTFAPGEEGAAPSLVLHQGGRDMPGKRKD